MWRKVFEADLNSTLSVAEINAFRQSSDFEHDPVEKQIRATCAYVRGFIRAANPAFQFPADEDALPESLIAPAMNYLRFNLLTRMNLVVNESRTKAYEDAKALFDEIRKGSFIPEGITPDDSSTDKATSPSFTPANPTRILD